MGGSARRAAAAALLLTLASTHDAEAAKWAINPDIGLRETRTDNVFLGGTSKESDFITQITPGLRVQGAGPRFRANLRYAPSVLLYAHHPDQNRVANALNAFGTLEAVEKFFYVDATGNISQGFVSPLGPQPSDIISATTNRAEARTYSLSPYVRSQLGRALTYELRSRNTWTSTDAASLSNIHARQWSARVASPVSLLGWALEYDQNRTSYTRLERPDYESKLGRARLFFQPNRELRLSASAGLEQNNYTVQQGRSYYIAGIGAVWKPGARTTVDLQYERRFFGPYRLARFDHRTRLTAWTLTYSRNASNYQQELLRLPPGDTAALLDAIFRARIPDPAARQAAVDEFLRVTGTPAFLANPLAFYTQQIFLQERLEGSMAILTRRSSVTFTAFGAQNTALSTGVAATLPDAFTPGSRIRLTGFGINASHQVTPFTTLAASARRTLAHQEEPAVSGTRNYFVSLNLNRRLSPKTNAFGGISYTRFDTTPASSSVYGNARSAYVGLYHQF